MDNPEPRAQYLNVVLRQVERTLLRIPRFQRHFVWNEKDVLDLLGSIVKGYPIGSVLTWKVSKSDDYFSGYREDVFPTAQEEVGSFEVVLDGAQRLSSLYGCLKNPGDHEIYNVVFDAREQSFHHVASLHPRADWHIPMDSLFDSRRFLTVQAAISELPDSDILLPRALDLYSTFQDYQIPIIALANAVLEDVVEVFRRINSSGTPLSSVDFVRALTWRSSFDLEETFQEFAERYQATPLEGFSEDFLIRCLAITTGLSLDSREIVRLKEASNRSAGLAEQVEYMRTALDQMAEFLSTLDVRGMKEIPYEVQRLLLFAIMLYKPDVDVSTLESWFWRSTFAEEHQSKPESYVTRLVRQLRNGNLSAALEVRKPVDLDLFSARVRRGGSAVATGFDLLLRRGEARSLLSGRRISPADSFHGLLFDRAELSPHKGDEVSSAVLANIVMLDKADASEWREVRNMFDLSDMFSLCQSRTDCAQEIWNTQGLDIDLNVDPVELLRNRSRRLLSTVL